MRYNMELNNNVLGLTESTRMKSLSHKKRSKPGLIRRPADLQSDALPLSYWTIQSSKNTHL